MNTTEMLVQLRLNTLLEDGAVDYTDDALLREMTDALTTKFQDTIVSFRNGTWEQQQFTTLTTGRAAYRIPRHMTVLGKVEIGMGSSSDYDSISFTRLPMVQEGSADLFERSYSGVGTPCAYVLRGSDLVILPTPDNGGYVIKITYFRKPPRLVASQNGVAGSTSRGSITAVDPVARTITVNTMPFNMTAAVPAAISGTANVDVVKFGGWFDHALSFVSGTIAGNVITIAGTQPMRNIAVGDWLRPFEQSEWPMLPEDFHRCVVDVASAKILVQRGYQQKAANFAGDVTADLQRFVSLYSNRTREEPRRVRAPLTELRRWRRP